MKRFIRGVSFRVAGLLALYLLTGSGGGVGVLCAQDIEGGKITGEGKRQRLAVAVQGPTDELTRLLRSAFGFHGGFEVSDAASAAFSFTFVAEGQSSVRLQIGSGGQTQFEQSFPGRSLREAVLTAADTAVAKTTGVSGFFSGQLVFVSKRSGFREIYISDIFFSKVTQMTRAKSNSILPQWSPDGSRILFTGYHRSGFPDLLMIDRNSLKVEAFASYKGTNTGGIFSPDGRSVAMILSSRGNPELYVGSATPGATPRQLTQTDSVESSPTWSPDGRMIAYTSDQMGGPQIFQIPAKGGAAKLIETRISGYCTDPDWNPREINKIVFTAKSGAGYQLALYDSESGKSYFLTTSGTECSQPAWLNDGRHIIYTRRDAGSDSLWICDSVTGKNLRLSPVSLGDAAHADFIPYR